MAKAAAFIVAALIAPVTIVGAANSSRVCASSEDTTCSCSGTVFYGIKFQTLLVGSPTTSLEQLKASPFKQKTLGEDGEVECSNEAMGGDPAPLRRKWCYCEEDVPSTPGQDVVTQVNYSGYLVDRYCFGLVRAGGRALDRTNPIKDPSQHTLHCLRDPSQCREGGYYVAMRDNATGDYGIKFQFDSAGNTAALALLDSMTEPGRDPGMMTVTAMGTTNGDGIMRNAKLVLCKPLGSAQCDGVLTCSGPGCDDTKNNGDLFPDVPLPAPRLLWAHVVCMLISWGCLLPLGVLWAHNLRWSDQKWCSTPIWFQGHRVFQMVGWTFQLLGFIFIFLHKGGFAMLGGHFAAPHEIIGLTVVIIGTLQPLNAQLRHFECIGHPPAAGEERSWGRFLWEIGHKGLGYIAVLLGALNVVLGIRYARNFGFEGALVPFAIVIASLSLGTQACIAVGAEVYRAYSSYKSISLDSEGSEEEEEGPEMYPDSA